jgi:hypothetical protein
MLHNEEGLETKIISSPVELPFRKCFIGAVVFVGFIIPVVSVETSS